MSAATSFPDRRSPPGSGPSLSSSVGMSADAGFYVWCPSTPPSWCTYPSSSVAMSAATVFPAWPLSYHPVWCSYPATSTMQLPQSGAITQLQFSGAAVQPLAGVASMPDRPPHPVNPNWYPSLPSSVPVSASTGLDRRPPSSRPSPSSSVAMSAADGFPNWVLLEPFVFCRDDESFPDDTMAPIRAAGTTTWGANFKIAFSLAEPPHISRLYAQLPVLGFGTCKMGAPISILATHRHLALLPVTKPSDGVVQNFFIFKANQSNPSKSSLQVLPPCTEPEFDYSCVDDCKHCPPVDTTRLLKIRSLGLWCGGKDFVVAELTLYIPTRDHTKAFADICMLRSDCTTPSAQHQLAGGRWESVRMEILSTDNPPSDLWQLCCWETDTAIPFQRWLCWIDYHQGILFCDMSKLTTQTVSFLSFPLDPFTSTHTPFTSTTMRSCLYSGVSVVHHDRALKFASVSHHSGLSSTTLEPSNGFTITCHTLVLGGSMTWEKDYTVTSDDLGVSESLQCGTLMFPRVDIDRPHVVHFLSAGFGANKQKVWVVSIDMSTKTLESSRLYMNGRERHPDDDDFFIVLKSTSPMPFLPCEFPRFCSDSQQAVH